MTPYDPALIASSTAIVAGGGAYLYQTVWGFMPILLTILIPLLLLFGAWKMIKGKAKVH